ncbi:unnamed protein product [Adineta steineri]|uniref:Uncharacterized protein n=1 Tax=Adineta steineri TaxID=433720 RepID=A0A816ALB3_9BILA|nr:unnamed protein product [Adineta steineri]CAF1064842.1 unnamed protein product [Adineta steineri]CAF1170416.1 unnamed protein product [Adineta steineri]CAF1597655.1 unnamed protein product [Adineta steineri]CAF1597791.1 unnamed protein product [Adineta steineri]
MGLCFDSDTNQYEYCSSHLTTYIAVGVIVPLAILLIIMLAYIYLRCRQRQLRRQHQQTYMATIIPIYNTDQQSQASSSFNYPYPPHYTSRSANGFDKPPSYEQTVQEVSTTNNDLALNPITTAAAVTTSEEPTESIRIAF